MILKKSDRYIVIDNITKEVISEHLFEDKRSMPEAEEAARKSNDEWKKGK